jgi:hypothetical protein
MAVESKPPFIHGLSFPLKLNMKSLEIEDANGVFVCCVGPIPAQNYIAVAIGEWIAKTLSQAVTKE